MDLTADDISVYILDSSDNEVKIQIPVLSIDNSDTDARTFTAFYTGAPMSNTYEF